MVVFNGILRQIEITDPADISLDVEQDIYSAWKDWSQVGDNSKYAPAMRTFGGDPTVQGQAAPKYFFLHNYWVVYINNGEIVNIALNLYSSDFTTPYIVVAGSGVSDRNSDAVSVNSSLIEYSSYNKGVTINTVSGTAGTVFPIGTPLSPVNNVTDALAIAELRGFKTFFVEGNLTFTNSDVVDGYTIIGSGQQESILTFGAGSENLDCTVQEATITGTGEGIIQFKECLLDNFTFAEIVRTDDIIITRCFFKNTFKMNSLFTGELKIVDSWSSVPGQAKPTLDLNNSTSDFLIRNYTGGLEIINQNQPIDASIDLVSGSILLDSTLTNGNYTIRGIGVLEDNTGGTAVVYDLLNTGGGGGSLTVDQATQLKELWQLQGLDPNAPMKVTVCAREAGTIELKITGDGVEKTFVERVV